MSDNKLPLKHLMEGLGKAINDALADSEKISKAIEEIRKDGFDIFLILEATIGFNKREDLADCASEAADKSQEKISGPMIKLTAQDEKFFSALKILVDPEDKA